MKSKETSGAFPGARVLLILSLFLFALPAVHASFGEEIDAETLEEMTGEQKFEYIFSSEGTGQSQFINEAWGEFDNWSWSFICIFAVLISMLAHGILYIIGKSIGARGLQRYALTEMIQVSATAVMLIALVGLIIGAFDLTSEMFGGTITCQGESIADPIRGDMCRTAELMTAANKLYKYAYAASVAAEMKYSLSIYMFGFPIYQGAWNSAWHKEIETLYYLGHTTVELMFFLSAKMFMLKYIQENMLQFFLPLGIILRTFHFTRGIGGFFIAIGIGFYFIYPTVVFMMDSSFVATTSAPELPDILTTGMCNLPMFGSFSFGSAALESSNIGASASNLSLSHNIGSFIANMYTHLLFSNMVAFAMTLTFVRFATTILGGDIVPFMGMVGRLV